jgi:hypothetical protein
VTGSVAATVSFGADGRRGGELLICRATATMAALLTRRGAAVQHVINGETLVGYQHFGGYQPLVDRTVHADAGFLAPAIHLPAFDQLTTSRQRPEFHLKTAGGSIGVSSRRGGDRRRLRQLTLSGRLLISVRDDLTAVVFTTGA